MLPDTSFLMGSFQGDLGRGKIVSYQLSCAEILTPRFRGEGVIEGGGSRTEE